MYTKADQEKASNQLLEVFNELEPINEEGEYEEGLVIYWINESIYGANYDGDEGFWAEHQPVVSIYVYNLHPEDIESIVFEQMDTANDHAQIMEDLAS